MSFLYRARRPDAPAVSEWVSESWMIRAARCPTAVEGLVADPAVLIYFNLGPHGRSVYDASAPTGDTVRRAWVVGPRSTALAVAKEVRDSDVVAVRLRPTVALHVLGVPANELRDGIVDLDHFWGGAVESIRERLILTTDPPERLRIVERSVVERATARAPRRDAALIGRLCADLGSGNDGVGRVAASLGISHRRAIELMKARTGLLPREYRRVRRFQGALRLANAGVRSWSRVAQAAGYADQPHLIREFRRLAGLTPVEYLRSRSPVGQGFVRLVMAPDPGATRP